MIVYDPLHPLQSSVIEVLAAKPGARIRDLHRDLLAEHGVDVSMPNLYRTIGQLVEHQVLVRRKQKLFLNSVWLTHLVQFSKSAEAQYLKSNNRLPLLPLENGSRRIYQAESLRGLNPIWNDMLVQIEKHTDDKKWYAYNSHPWYSIAMTQTEKRLYSGLISRKIEIYMLYGNNSFLDKYGDSLISMPGFNTARTNRCALPREGYSVWIAGDYILECSIPDAVTTSFAYFFDQVTSKKQFDLTLFTEIFSVKAICTMSVRKNREQSKQLKQSLVGFFL